LFGKLKEKLKGFTSSLNETIDEKAVELEEPDVVIQTEPSVIETPSQAEPKNIEALELTQAEEETETLELAPDEEDTKKSDTKKEKVGFFGKAKALIFDREVILDEGDLEKPLMELEIALLESDLALSVTDSIVASVKEQLSGTRKRIGKNTGSIVEEALKNAILEVMSANVFDFDEFIENRRDKTIHIVFVGINGTGKTTSIAKIANRLQKKTPLQILFQNQ
jgi:fused signal recognition particle receptor